MKRSVFILFIFCRLAANSSVPFKLTFVPQFGELIPFEEAHYYFDGADSVKFDVLKFYVSGITFYKGGKQVYAEPGSFHLVDASVPSSMVINVNIPDSSMDHIGFNLGIDSVTNNAGAMGGDLDPTKGMYWTWQSGYINFKLEGISNRSAGRTHEFQFHLGGYSFPNNALRSLQFEVRKSTSATIAIDLEDMFRQINFSKHSHIMSPGPDAMELSTLIQKCFRQADE